MKSRSFSISCAASVVLIALVALVAFIACAPPVTGSEEAANRYDLLGQVLQPLSAVFLPEYAGKAFAATLVLDAVPGLPTEWRGQEAKLVFQPPRMAKLSATVRGKEWALCRVRGELWGTPRDDWAALAKQFPQNGKQGKQKRGPGLPDFALPFSPQQLVFLPVLFQVDDDGRSPTGARLLKVRLAPTIVEGLQGNLGSSASSTEDLTRWSARLTIREVAGARPRLERIELSRPGWRFAADVRRWSLVRNVPATFWQPDTRSGEAAFRFSGVEARRWWEGAWHQWLHTR